MINCNAQELDLNILELKLVRGAVQLRYDFGLGPGVLRTTVQQYGDNNWHKVMQYQKTKKHFQGNSAQKIFLQLSINE